MSILGYFGVRNSMPAPPQQGHEIIVVQKKLNRVLAATGHTIDDVVNSPVIKRKILGFYKLHNWVERQSEISDLNRQWRTPSGL